MRETCIEFIRKILIKTVLPMRKRREKFLSKFHFSIGFRISFHYFMLLTLLGVFIFVPLMVLFYKTDLEEYHLVFHIFGQEFYVILEYVMWGILIAYIIIILCVIRLGQKGVERLFYPIEHMARIANKITVNNLHSDRLNIEGTKNELKDLAIIFNEMLDRLELSYESQKQFVSDASHELRTPIAVIQGYANLLDRWGKKDKEVMEESIEAIKNEAKNMQELVEKLLFLSRHDKKTLKLQKTKFRMDKMISEMVKETKMVSNNRTIEVPCIDEVTVYGDKQALKQAIRVFVENALKYTTDGDTIRISCKNENGDCIIIVEDTGIGMTKTDVEHIFERFYRSDHVRNEKISGHGLGLSIAKLIIVKHTGRIKVRSQYKRGSMFMVTIPKRATMDQ